MSEKLGKCDRAHHLGSPTRDGNALTQIAHQQTVLCVNWREQPQEEPRRCPDCEITGAYCIHNDAPPEAGEKRHVTHGDVRKCIAGDHSECTDEPSSPPAPAPDKEVVRHRLEQNLHALRRGKPLPYPDDTPAPAGTARSLLTPLRPELQQQHNVREFLEHDYGVSEVATLASMYDDAKAEVAKLRQELQGKEADYESLSSQLDDANEARERAENALREMVEIVDSTVIADMNLNHKVQMWRNKAVRLLALKSASGTEGTK